MKMKRFLFIASLIVLFGFCFYKMNQHYDELARYPYHAELSEKERTVILEHLDAEGINYLVTQKIKPDQFLPYLQIEGFDLNNTLWYDKASKTREEDTTYIINFINKYRERMEYGQLDTLLKHYSYNVLTRFFDEGYPYRENVSLIADPADRFALIGKEHTLYTYEPSQLTAISHLPHENIVDGSNDIMLKKEVVEPLESLLAAAKEINQKDYGDMTVIIGYLSYEDQISLLDSMKKQYGKEFESNWDYPGQSEYQLGYSVTLKANEGKEKTTNTSEEKEQATWLKENAYKYGFVVRYPKQKEKIDGKLYQPYTLRYVGKEWAKRMYDEEKVMEEMDFSIEHK